MQDMGSKIESVFVKEYSRSIKVGVPNKSKPTPKID
jgi:hypothetical protein